MSQEEFTRCGCRQINMRQRHDLNRQIKIARIDVTDNDEVIDIPVVIHICFSDPNTSEVELDVAHTLALLNKDFARNPDNYLAGQNEYSGTLRTVYDDYVGRSAACNITFSLDQIIYREVAAQSSTNLNTLDNNIKGTSPPMDPTTFLNIWVVTFNSGLLGYAQFPWELNLFPSTDGVVIADGTFGRNPRYTNFALGKTLTHEVGHWLGLYHTFQDTFNYQGGNIDYDQISGNLDEFRGDCVIDTPPQGDPTSGNPINNPNAWPQSSPSDVSGNFRHMYMNYMDYSDDAAMFMFTRDQKEKMRLLMFLHRTNMITNRQLIDSAPSIFKEATFRFESSSNSFFKRIRLLNGANYFNSRNQSLEGFRCLRTRLNGRILFEIDLSGAQQILLCVGVRSSNNQTRLWSQSPGTNVWRSVKIPRTGKYRCRVFKLPGPFDKAEDGTCYKFMLGTSGNSRTYSFFDDLKIVNPDCMEVSL